MLLQMHLTRFEHIPISDENISLMASLNSCMPELSGKTFMEACHDTAEAATNASSRRLTLNQVVSVIDNVSAEEYGPQQGEDCVLHWAWRKEDLEHGPHQQRHQASK